MNSNLTAMCIHVFLASNAEAVYKILCPMVDGRKKMTTAFIVRFFKSFYAFCCYAFTKGEYCVRFVFLVYTARFSRPEAFLELFVYHTMKLLPQEKWR